MGMRTAAAVLLTALILAVAAGCGGDDGGSGAATTTATATRTATTGAATTTAPDDTLTDTAAQEMDTAIETTAPDPSTSAATHATETFLRASFISAQDLWRRQFAAAGATYRPAHLRLFHHAVHTACGTQSAEVGPFYCPADETVYLNTTFFGALARAYNLRSGFAAGYVTAHEVGHHVQNVLGLLTAKAHADAADPAGANARSILTELQADCYAGVWLHELHGAGSLTNADINDIIRAATVVGDDFQRNQAGAPLAPETWTHGSSEQRVRWLTAGMRSGVPATCDTFRSAAAGSGG
ncbi:MAG TPA: neutral zinc metallopeptidase [Baekduia sp.]|uniref:KPN_02809 family neutral zinc metallopeptidase n=1 Tax=Baekduia sp. TaxID=2600305 RepID=UPI002D76AD18|nr:neutral zinc metallopeptidase [Baekduia sp.]HET6505295.1 neutral zinc metallopeptidase [Baekduia sp.]